MVMRFRPIFWVVITALGASLGGVRSARAESPRKPDDAPKDAATSSAARKPAQAIDSALSFLTNDAVKWRAERGCATCHHGAMTVWALSEAKSQGYAVATDKFAEI